MPTYQFYSKKTGKVVTDAEMRTISEMERTLKDNPDWDTVPAAPLIHSGRGLKKPDDGFRDHLRRIKKHHIGSTINTFD